jgi:peptidoglycan-associated lipoprotein
MRIGVFLLVAATTLACQSGSGPSPSGSEFDPEPSGRDPGMSGSSGGSGAGGSAMSGGLHTIYFDFDESALRADAKQSLQNNAKYLNQNSGTSVQIEGNCDERGSEEYNLALGMRRAEAAKRYLMDLGIDGSRMSTISFGEERPAVRGSSEAAWAKNRRDDFKTR